MCFNIGFVNKKEQDESIAQDTIFKSIKINNCPREVKLRTDSLSLSENTLHLYGKLTL
jgi:hypothetical protein